MCTDKSDVINYTVQYSLKDHMSRKFLIFLFFDAMIKDEKRIMLLKNRVKNSCSFKNYVNLFNVETFICT